MSGLRDLKCVPCRGGVPPLEMAEISGYLPEVPGWRLVERQGVQQLERTFKFEDFIQALGFTLQIGHLAEAEGHHPAILTEWGQVTITWWTHKIKGLHRNDFIMAAKTDAIFSPLEQ